MHAIKRCATDIQEHMATPPDSPLCRFVIVQWGSLRLLTCISPEGEAQDNNSDSSKIRLAPSVGVNSGTEIRGVVKYTNKDGVPIKLQKGDMIILENGNVLHNKETLLENVSLSPKSSSRKEVILTATSKTECRTLKLHFDSSKEAASSKDEIAKLLPEQRKRSSSFSEKAASSTAAEDRLQVRYKLLRLLRKRSEKSLLEKKGILKNEPIFGNTLVNLYAKDGKHVPEFVESAASLIELPKNVDSLGLYRASGNLATIQKIRFLVDRSGDKSSLRILEMYQNDTDVLTGALKLFFRELKEPLVPHKTCEELSLYIDSKIDHRIEKKLRSAIAHLHPAHRETLLFLAKHLVKVETRKADNCMDFHNLAVVWGPTLMWPPDTSTETALQSHTNATKVLEIILNLYQHEFAPTHTDSPASKSWLSTVKKEPKIEPPAEPPPAPSVFKTRSLENLLGLFKQPKDAVQNLETLSQNGQVPEFVVKAVDLIEKQINTEGLYRMSGDWENMDKIKRKMIRSKYGSMDKYGVHNVAIALKTFFMHVKPPLIPKETFYRLADLTGDPPQSGEIKNHIHREIANLPPAHRSTFEFLIQHLNKVSQHEASNKMTKYNLATMWTPSLCYQFMGKDNVKKFISTLECILRTYSDPLPPRTPLITKEDIKEQWRLVARRTRTLPKDATSLHENARSVYDNDDPETDKFEEYDTKL